MSASAPAGIQGQVYESGWFTQQTASGAWHLLPLDDLRLHEASDCWCDPFEDEEGECIVHNSADGREAFETGARKPS